MKLYRIPTTIIIADLVKSVGAAFIYMGVGFCLDSNGNRYDNVYLHPLPSNDFNAAFDWCKTATVYVSGLVGVTIGNGRWYCWYDDGSLSGIYPKNEFTPRPSDLTVNYIGTGAIAGVSNHIGWTCFKNEVRTADTA